MVQIEQKIKSSASGSLYAEYAKKQDCWEMLTSEKRLIDSSLIDDFVYKKSQFEQRQAKKRKRDDFKEEDLSKELEIIQSYKSQSWIEFGKIIQQLENVPQSYYRASIKIASELKLNKILSNQLIKKGLEIIDIISEYSPETFNDINNIRVRKPQDDLEINTRLLKQMSDYANGSRILSQKQLGLLFEIAHNMKPLNEYNKTFAKEMLELLLDSGFVPKQ